MGIYKRVPDLALIKGRYCLTTAIVKEYADQIKVGEYIPVVMGYTIGSELGFKTIDGHPIIDCRIIRKHRNGVTVEHRGRGGARLHNFVTYKELLLTDYAATENRIQRDYNLDDEIN